MLTVLDVYSRECVVLEAGRAFRGDDVARVLSAAGQRRGSLLKVISVDNGTEFNLEGSRSLGLLEPGEARLQPTGQADR